jgi:hypothetical protein
MGKNIVAMGALLAALAGAQTAAAQTPSERLSARHLMDDGDRYTEKKEFAEALRVYVAAHAIMRVPTTGIEVARTYAALGRLVEAREAALEVAASTPHPNDPKPFAAARREGAELAAQLDKRIAILRIELAGADPASVRTSIDDHELPAKAIAQPQRVNPGRHMVRVRAAGSEPVLRQVDAYEGTSTVVRIELETPAVAAAPPPRPFGMPPLALAGLATAATGLTIGTITGLISLSKASDAKTLCGSDPKNCDPAAANAIDSSKTFGWVATVSFALAIAGGALATYTLINKPDSNSARPARLDVVVGAGGAGLTGTF